MSQNKLQHFERPIIDIIKSRYSVRTYCGENLPEEIKNKLRHYISSIKGPFDSKVRLELIDSFEISEKADGKIGTYGVIKGAKDYIAAISESGEKDLEQLGYMLEKLVLYAASLNLGTCWLGGTFKRSEFAKLTALKQSETLPIVMPVGYPADKKSFLESFMRLAAGSNQRKPWKELFFNESFASPLEEGALNAYAKALEALRFAPSASNKQPWRVLKKGDTYQFHLMSSKGYAEGLGFNIQRIDIGIAMCHFEMVLEELGVKGNWKIEELGPRSAHPDNMTYIVSWTL
jgi:nitroreductase